MARFALRTGARAVKLAMRSAKKPRKARVVKPAAVAPFTLGRTAKSVKPRSRATLPQRTLGMVSGISGARRYQLFKPVGVQRTERLPLVVMLHGCAQDAEDLAASTKMNRLAQAERFMVLYPEQDQIANMQNCWNWYDTRSGTAQREAESIVSAVDHICKTEPVNRLRLGLVGLSAGAGLASLIAVRQPEHFRAVVMHSGIGPGQASSTASALSAMRGRRTAVPLAPLAVGLHLPAMLVIQGSADPIVAASNGAQAAKQWAEREGAKPARPRTLQRGKRYSAEVTDYRTRGRLVATLCIVNGLGHAWSGGAPGLPYSEPKGPDATRMAWSFIQKQFAPEPG